MEKVNNFFVGASGLAGTEIASTVLETADVSNIVQVVVQILIGVATLLGLFKKGKK